jgi:hypothetical protein
MWLSHALLSAQSKRCGCSIVLAFVTGHRASHTPRPTLNTIFNLCEKYADLEDKLIAAVSTHLFPG